MTDRRLRTSIVAVSLAGLAVAGYLTYVHYAGLRPLCLSGGGGCETVQTSDYAKLGGVPVALLGLLGYGAILGSVLLPDDIGVPAGAGLALIGFGFSAYLTYRELFSIHAICEWCVTSAVLMTLLAIITTVRLLRSPVEVGVSP
jgi:uncharacterized membrane protein